MFKLPPIHPDSTKTASPQLNESTALRRNSSTTNSPRDGQNDTNKLHILECSHSSPNFPLIKNNSLLSERTDTSMMSLDSYESQCGASATLIAEPSIVSYDDHHQDTSSVFSPSNTNFNNNYNSTSTSTSPSPTKFRAPSLFLAPLEISPYQPTSTHTSRNPSMSPSSVPLRNLKSFEASFPDNVRPHSPGETDEASSLLLRKKALTPMNLLRGMMMRQQSNNSALVNSNNNSPTGNSVFHHNTSTLSSTSSASASASIVSPKLFASHQNVSSSLSGSLPPTPVFATTTNHRNHYTNQSHPHHFQTAAAGGSPMFFAPGLSSLSDAEVEETVKHAIAVALSASMDHDNSSSGSNHHDDDYYDHKKNSHSSHDYTIDEVEEDGDEDMILDRGNHRNTTHIVQHSHTNEHHPDNHTDEDEDWKMDPEADYISNNNTRNNNQQNNTSLSVLSLPKLV